MAMQKVWIDIDEKAKDELTRCIGFLQGLVITERLHYHDIDSVEECAELLQSYFDEIKGLMKNEDHA
jgi:hypothetical protein